jgi:mRNA interferase MazF
MYLQGDIVKVPFLYTDNTGSKSRPAVIISNRLVNTSNDVICAQITAKPRNDQFTLKIENQDLDIPLPCPSQVRCHKIFIVDAKLIEKKISHLKQDKFSELINKISALIKPLP